MLTQPEIVGRYVPVSDFSTGQYSPRPEIITSESPSMIPYLSHEGCTVQQKGFY